MNSSKPTSSCPPRRQHTVIVILTTSTLDADQVRAQQLLIAGYLTKPLTRENMATVLRVHSNLPPLSEYGFGNPSGG